MTVSYNLDVSSSKAWTFLKLMFRWRGSIWKSCLGELGWWVAGYYVMFGVFRLFNANAKMCVQWPSFNDRKYATDRILRCNVRGLTIS